MAGLTDLHAVTAVARHRSFRLAATDLGVSTSALSRIVSTFEQRLGVRLFNRTTRSVAVSEAGEAFLARVTPALREISQAMEAVNAQRDTPFGTLRINTSEGAARQILTPIVIAFLRRYPDMRIDLVTDGRLVDIVGEGFDAGLRLAEMVPQDMIATPCGPAQQRVVVAAPGYLEARGRPIAPADLLSHECIRHRLPGGAIDRWTFSRHGEQLSLDVRGALTLDSHDLRAEAAMEGVGVAYLWRWFVDGQIEAGRLVTLLDDWTTPRHDLCLYYPRNRHMSAGLRAFIALARERRGVDSASRSTPLLA